jgi:predicted PurR-regulated permease PerM
MANQREQIIAIFFFALLLFVMHQLIQIFSSFFQAFFWAAILAYAFYPMHQLFCRLARGRLTLAALISTAAIVLIVIPPSFLMLKNLLNQTLQLYQQATSFINRGDLAMVIEAIQSFAWFQAFQEKVMTSGLVQQNLSQVFLRATQYFANLATTQVAGVTKNLLFIFFNFLLMIFLLFYLFKNGEKTYQFVYKLVPFEETDRKAVFARLNETFSGVIRGQFLTSIVQGVLAGFTLYLLDFRAFAFFGLATFFASLIPITGASTVWMPIAVYLFLLHETKKAVILTLVGIFVISMSDNVLKPILIGEKTKIPVFLLFFGILGGMRVYGLTGMFLGPVFITLFFALIKIYQEKYHRQG